MQFGQGRFARMEALLELILQKLEIKADAAQLLELERRHADLERRHNELEELILQKLEIKADAAQLLELSGFVFDLHANEIASLMENS